MKVEINLDNQEEIEVFIEGLAIAEKDARDYYQACTPHSEDDIKTLKYWFRRSAILQRLKEDVIEACSHPDQKIEERPTPKK